MDKTKHTPSDTELRILRIFWRRGGALTVEDLQNSLGKNWAYSTMRTTMNRMVEKKLLVVMRVGKKSHYAANCEPEAAERSVIRRFLDSLFGGSARALVGDLLAHGELKPGELEQLRVELGAEAGTGRQAADGRTEQTTAKATGAADGGDGGEDGARRSEAEEVLGARERGGSARSARGESQIEGGEAAGRKRRNVKRQGPKSRKEGT